MFSGSFSIDLEISDAVVSTGPVIEISCAFDISFGESIFHGMSCGKSHSLSKSHSSECLATKNEAKKPKKQKINTSGLMNIQYPSLRILLCSKANMEPSEDILLYIKLCSGKCNKMCVCVCVCV